MIHPEVEQEQVARLKAMKQRRDARRHEATLGSLRDAAVANENVMPHLVEAAEAGATVGEMTETLRTVHGQYDGGPEL